MAEITAKPGESCSNNHFSDRYTCPNCFIDHELRPHNEPIYITCECGARLRCELELIESSACTIADPDEDED
jgi:hypothetical protein